MHTNRSEVTPLRLGVVGCGAVAELLHLRAAADVRELMVTCAADLDGLRAKEISQRFRIPNWSEDWREMIGEVDALLIATPPHSHAAIALEAIGAGLHVLMEKPLATNLKAAEELVEAATQQGLHLAVGHARRFFWNSEVVKDLLESGRFGAISRVEIEEGGPYNWPIRTDALFDKTTGAGVLLANGIHNLDLLWWWFGPNISVTRFRSDGWHGPEANCMAEFEIRYQESVFRATIELSTTRALENRIVIVGSDLSLEVSSVYEGDRLILGPGAEYGVFGSERVIAQKEQASTSSMLDAHAEQLRRFARSCMTDAPEYVSGTDAVCSLRLVHECHARQETLSFPWLTYGPCDRIGFS